MTATITGGNDDPTFKRQAFDALLSRIRKHGGSKLPGADRVAIAELSRQATAHSSPKVRKFLEERLEEIRKAHLEHCFSKK
jgi:hypothetical protein